MPKYNYDMTKTMSITSNCCARERLTFHQIQVCNRPLVRKKPGIISHPSILVRTSRPTHPITDAYIV